MNKLLCIRSWPRAIIHVDGDSFFASCEQAANPTLKGKPVVVGSERGICVAVSYEAKKRGVVRGMRGYEIKEVCPECIFLPTHFSLYSMISSRMFAIVRRYTPIIEEASIDECYADITGLQRTLRMSYEKIAESIKRDLERELGMTFSLGLAPTKTLAKIGSKLNKPSGLVIIPGKQIHTVLEKVSLDAVCGIGYRTSEFLRKQGIHTSLAYAEKGKYWIEEHMSKPYKHIYYELRGISLLPVRTAKRLQKSISKTGTFYPPTNNKAFLLAQLSVHVERSCAKARRHMLSARKVQIFLKRQDFVYHRTEITLSSATNIPSTIQKHISHLFDTIYRGDTLFRSTGITLSDFSYNMTQTDLFGEHIEVESIKRVFSRVDMINEKFGKHTVFLGSSKKAMSPKQNISLTIGIPYMGTIG